MRKVLVILCLFAATLAYADTYTGVLLDSISGESLPAANIVIKGTLSGVSTDDDGRFRMQAEKGQTLVCSYLGYITKEVVLTNEKALTINMIEDNVNQQLQEVTVTSGRYRYSKRNNAAVDFIKRAIARRDTNAITSAQYYERSVYEKMSIGVTDIKIKENSKSGFQQIIRQSDSTAISHRPVLFFLLDEKQMDEYYRLRPQVSKTIVNGYAHQSVADQVIGEETISKFTDMFFKDIDIYKSNINIGFKDFVGPLSSIAPDFYMFFITDTLYVDSIRCLKIGFTPRNSSLFGFTGSLTLEEQSCAVRQAQLEINKNININYLDALQITQTFESDSTQRMVVTNEKIAAELYIIKAINGVYAERNRSYRNYIFDRPNDSILNSIEGYQLVRENATQVDSVFWAENRTDTLRTNENKIGELVTALKSNKGTKAIMYFLELLIKGYQRTSDPSYFDIGPVYSFLSGSTVEGVRLKVAGETTANLSPYVFLSGYGAYGFRDQQWKYGGTAEFSFNKKKVHAREWPVHSIALHYEHDMRALGEEPLHTLKDNLFYSIKRTKITNFLYYDQTKLRYTYEHRSGLSLYLDGLYEWQRPSDTFKYGTISFKQINNTGDTISIPQLRHNEIALTLRYAPHESETFVQGRIFRFNTRNKWPIFTLTHRASIAGIMGCQYGYQATEFSYHQNYFLSAYGVIDCWLKAGKIWTGNVAYPYLYTPNANTSFTIVDESFSQVDPLEFVADQFASWDITLNSFLLFNSIPGIKRAHLREVVGFKGYWGYLSDKNNPMLNHDLLLLPEETIPLTTEHMKEPYMEFSVGIDNIFTCLRIDYVRRINYLNSPAVKRNPMGANGVRIVLNFQF